MKNNFVALKDSKYGEGIVVEVYNGTISIVAARKGSDGNVYMDWCFPQTGTYPNCEPNKTAVPWKLVLGNTVEEVIKMLGRLGKKAEDIGGNDEDLPFD